MESLAPAQQPGEWRFRVTPYLWAAGISGEFEQSGLPAVEVNQSFGDVLEHLDAGVMGAFEAWHGRHGLFADLIHVRLSGTGEAGGLLPVPIPIEVISTSTTAMAGGQYRWIDGERGHLDLLGGLRHWSLSTRLRVGAPISESRRERVGWTDPVVGLKGLRWLDERVYLTGWVMAGGWVGNAEPFFDVMAGVGYKLDERRALILAYRSLGADYRDGAFRFDAVQQGFGIGIDIRF